MQSYCTQYFFQNDDINIEHKLTTFFNECYYEFSIENGPGAYTFELNWYGGVLVGETLYVYFKALYY